MDEQCSVDGCERSAKTRGWCPTHYTRWLKYGDVNVVRPRGKPATPHPCTVDGCSERPIARGLCSMHYQRLRLYGDPGPAERKRRANGTGCLQQDGYITVYDPAHPLARASTGSVLWHRRELYDRIGPGEHPCFYCGRTLRWDVTIHEGPDALTVDHLDWNRENNDPENLVPSCNACNCRRSERQLAIAQMRLMTLAIAVIAQSGR